MKISRLRVSALISVARAEGRARVVNAHAHSSNEWNAKNREKRRVSARVWRAGHLEHARQRNRESQRRRTAEVRVYFQDYYKDEDNRAVIVGRSKKRYHEAYKAYIQALKDGSLIRQPCEVCGSLHSEGHHTDYSKPLEVQWLCRKHHKQEHARIRNAEQWMRFCFARLGWTRRLIAECNGVSLSTVTKLIEDL